MSAMAVVIQAMTWLGLPQPPMWKLILYMLCIGMFGVGVGMLYTPILVDRMQLKFPSGLAVANILRALTDVDLLRRSVARLFGGMALGIIGGIDAAEWSGIPTAARKTAVAALCWRRLNPSGSAAARFRGSCQRPQPGSCAD